MLKDSVCNTPAQNMILIKDSQWAQRLWTVRKGAIAKPLNKDSALDMLETKEFSSASNGRLVSRPRSRSNPSDVIMSKTNINRFIDQL